MSTLEEIKRALKRLSTAEQEDIINWLQELGGTQHSRDRIEEPHSTQAQLPPPYMTIDEYFAFEETSQFRHEYVNGVVHAVEGRSVAHVQISMRLLVAFGLHLRGGPCEAFGAGLMLRIRSETDEIVYCPDVVVACNKHEWGKSYVSNPKLVVEVLSPSTEHIDRREKAMIYRRVMSVEEYALVEQEEHKIVVHRRAEGWKPQLYVGPQAVAEFRSIALAVPLKQIYAGTPSQE